jgi:hypothetical protein
MQDQKRDHLDALWYDILRCQEWIQAALDHSARSHEFRDISDMIMKGSAQLWPTENGCCVTFISDYPVSKMLQLWLMGGDFEEVYNEHYSAIEQFAKDRGCDQIFVNGRKGWERRLKKLGYKFSATVLVKELDNG